MIRIAINLSKFSGTTEQSWTMSDVEGDSVWYFSFGPMMAKSFISDTKQFSTLNAMPSKSVPGFVPTHQLAFTMM